MNRWVLWPDCALVWTPDLASLSDQLVCSWHLASFCRHGHPSKHWSGNVDDWQEQMPPIWVLCNVYTHFTENILYSLSVILTKTMYALHQLLWIISQCNSNVKFRICIGLKNNRPISDVIQSAKLNKHLHHPVYLQLSWILHSLLFEGPDITLS